MQFDNFADEYATILDENVAISGESSAYFASYKAQYLRQKIQVLSSGKVLDFGCGIGMLSGFLKQQFPQVQLHGFDVSEASVQKVPDELKRAGYFTSNASDLSSDYDLIVLANVMHHVPPEQRRTLLQDLAGRLSNSGTLAIFEHNPGNPVTRWAVEHCAFDEDAILLPPAETIDRLQTAKLHIRSRDYIVFMPRFLAWLRPLEPWLSWLPMGAQYVVLAERRS